MDTVQLTSFVDTVMLANPVLATRRDEILRKLDSVKTDTSELYRYISTYMAQRFCESCSRRAEFGPDHSRHPVRCRTHQIDTDVNKFIVNKDEYYDEAEVMNQIIHEGMDLVEGVYKCRRCKSEKTLVKQAQTRSADEGMTTFVLCVACGNKWKD